MERMRPDAVEGPANEGAATVRPSMQCMCHGPVPALLHQIWTEPVTASCRHLTVCRAPWLQLIGNGLKSWRQYYDLNRTTREGQTALDRMHVWRDNIKQALLMRTPADADQEIDESEDAEEEEQVMHDEELGAGLLIDEV